METNTNRDGDGASRKWMTDLVLSAAAWVWAEQNRIYIIALLSAATGWAIPNLPGWILPKPANGEPTVQAPPSPPAAAATCVGVKDVDVLATTDQIKVVVELCDGGKRTYTVQGAERLPQSARVSEPSSQTTSVSPQKAADPIRVSTPNMKPLLEVNVRFLPGRSDLGPEGLARTEQLARVLLTAANTRVELRGYCDLAGDKRNPGLADRRALAIRDYLVNLGVARDRITISLRDDVEPAIANIGLEKQVIATVIAGAPTIQKLAAANPAN